ncbi:MAG: hypothetical protein HUU54_10260 [Ignavibacteriaceae bacterium]|nr:hypothetical protein [Ignavibacteriaceae bacterium]
MILKSKKGEKGIRVYDDLRKADPDDTFDTTAEYGHQLPELPGWCDRNYACGTRRSNPFRITCTCDEFQSASEDFSGRDIRRLCAHLSSKLISPAYAKILDPLTLLLIENQLKHGREHLSKYKTGDDFFLTGKGNGKEWVTVYVKEKRWRRFAYNKKEKRWAYNSFPEKSEEIISILSPVLNKKR